MKFISFGGAEKLHLEALTQEEDNRAPASKTGEFVSLVIAVAGNLSVAALYFYAFRHPGLYAEFIFKTGMLIYIVEFLSIHSNMMVVSFRKRGIGAAQKTVFNAAAKSSRFGGGTLRKYRRGALFGIYLIFVATISLPFKNWFIPFQFIVSMISKFYGGKASAAPFKSGLMIILFIVSTFAVVIFAPLIRFLFPLAQEVLNQKIPGSSGLFIDAPQTLLIWGMLYFVSLAIMEFALFRRRTTKFLKKPEAQNPAGSF